MDVFENLYENEPKQIVYIINDPLKMSFDNQSIILLTSIKLDQEIMVNDLNLKCAISLFSILPAQLNSKNFKSMFLLISIKFDQEQC